MQLSQDASVASLQIESSGASSPLVVAVDVSRAPEVVARTLHDLRPGELVEVGVPALHSAPARLLTSIDSARLVRAARLGVFASYRSQAAADARDAIFDERLLLRDARLRAAEAEMRDFYDRDRRAGDPPALAYRHAVGEFAACHPGMSPDVVARSALMLARDVSVDPLEADFSDARRSGCSAPGFGPGLHRDAPVRSAWTLDWTPTS